MRGVFDVAVNIYKPLDCVMLSVYSVRYKAFKCVYVVIVKCMEFTGCYIV